MSHRSPEQLNRHAANQRAYNKRLKERFGQEYLREKERERKRRTKSERARTSKIYYAANKERMNANAREYHRTHKDEINARIRRWYQNNKAKKRDAQKLWKINNPEKAKAIADHHNHRRKAMAAQLPETLTDSEWREILATDLYKCRYCGCNLTYKTATRDHATPLSRGGGYTRDNIVPACIHCNSKKGTKTAEEFLSGN